MLASKAAHRIAEIMIFTAQEQTPDVPAVVEPALCACWEKGMEAVYAEKDGEKYLIPWTPPPPKNEGQPTLQQNALANASIVASHYLFLRKQNDPSLHCRSRA